MEEVNTGSTGSTENTVSIIDKELQDMYKVVVGKIRLSVANQQLTPESFETILLKVVETVEELAKLKGIKMTGIEKRSIAINLTRMVIEDLHTNGQMSDDVYSSMKIALIFLAPIIFAALKVAWKKLQDVQADIQTHGKAGCCARNFFGKPKI